MPKQEIEFGCGAYLELEGDTEDNLTSFIRKLDTSKCPLCRLESNDPDPKWMAMAVAILEATTDPNMQYTIQECLRTYAIKTAIVSKYN